MPEFRMLRQYIKDLSFENPNAPRSLDRSRGQPNFEVQVDLQVRPQGQDIYETDLKIGATATREDSKDFILELVYAGQFLIRNLPQDQHHPLMLIESPRLLFPFARRIIADCTQEGGYPPLMLDPIDFAALYRQRMQQQQQQQQQPAQSSAGGVSWGPAGQG
jgi:preprotein translocase subunit SecB